jgi:hypothetical protein
LDYVVALLMISMPWLMGFDESSSGYWPIIFIGCFVILFSFCTDYEFGFLEEIEIRTHLLLDFLVGIVLIVSPWLFGFYDKVYLPYLVFGMIEIATTFFTKTESKILQNLTHSNKHRPLRHNV